MQARVEGLSLDDHSKARKIFEKNQSPIYRPSRKQTGLSTSREQLPTRKLTKIDSISPLDLRLQLLKDKTKE
jgi:hypothetical protein